MKINNLVLGIGIFVVFMFMIAYGIQAFYPAPQYDSYCEGNIFVPKFIEPYAQCISSRILQEAEQACYNSKGFPEYTYNDTGCAIAVKECNYCQRDFENARLHYDKNVFVIALLIGIITLFLGYSAFSTEPVSSSLMASGIGAIFYGSAKNWENLSNIWRFLLLVTALILLIWIALKINKKRI